MQNEPHFQNKELNSEDYAAEEGRADIVKNCAGLIALIGGTVFTGVKIIPKIAKGISKIKKA